MSTLAKRYIQLAYGIEHYFPGYIDAYFGPDELKHVEKQSLEALVQTADVLREDSAEASPWLQTQITSMQGMLAKLSGKDISYSGEVHTLYDIEPQYTNESHFQKAHARLNELLEGNGDLGERLETFRKRFTVPRETLPKIIEHVSSELRQRTKKLFNLPGTETFKIELVNNKPWGGYNWYLGNYRSRIDINMDLPKHLHELPHLLAHEGYPGHHTEHTLKEKHLCKGQGKLEHTLYLLNSPTSVQAEGIAENALETMLSEDEIKTLLLELLPLSDIQASQDDVGRMLEVSKAKETLSPLGGNAALLLHEQKTSPEDVLSYLQRYSLNSLATDKKTLEFLQAPASASYMFTYIIGKDLVQQVLKTGNPQEKFGQLLLGAYTPSMMRELAAQTQ